MRTITVQCSPDADDLFMMRALTSGQIDTGDIEYQVKTAPTDALNRIASGNGADVVANVCDRVFFELEAPVARVSGEDIPAPYAKNLEQACIPDVPKIVAAAKRTLKA